MELRELFSHVVDVSPSLSTESPDSDRQTVDDFYTRQARYDIVFVCLSVSQSSWYSENCPQKSMKLSGGIGYVISNSWIDVGGDAGHNMLPGFLQ